MLTILIIIGAFSVAGAVVAIVENDKAQKEANRNWNKFQKKHPGKDKELL